MRYAFIAIGLLALVGREVAAMDPVPESCSITDENACDDGNPCTEDVCFQKLRPIDNTEFLLNGVCTHTIIEECAVGLPPPPPVVTPVETPAETPPPTADPVAEEPEPEAPAPEAPANEEPAPVSAPQPEPEGILEDFPDCLIPEDELRAMEPSQLIAKYGADEFEKCVLAGGGAGAGLEKAAKNPSGAGGGCSLVGAESSASSPLGSWGILLSILAVFAGLAFRFRQNQKRRLYNTPI